MGWRRGELARLRELQRTIWGDETYGAHVRRRVARRKRYAGVASIAAGLQMLIIAAVLALLPNAAFAHTGVISISCTQVTFTYQQFAAGTFTAHESVTVDGTLTAVDFTFNGPGASDAIAITLGAGTHTVSAATSWASADGGGSAHASQVLSNCGNETTTTTTSSTTTTSTTTTSTTSTTSTTTTSTTSTTTTSTTTTSTTTTSTTSTTTTSTTTTSTTSTTTTSTTTTTAPTTTTTTTAPTTTTTTTAPTTTTTEPGTTTTLVSPTTALITTSTTTPVTPQGSTTTTTAPGPLPFTGSNDRPELAALAMLGAGLVGIGMGRRRRARG